MKRDELLLIDATKNVLLRGDNTSMNVIFNNIDGVNFNDKEKHKAYLHRMFCVTNLKPGQEIYLTDGKGNIIKKSKVKTDE